MWRNGRVSHRWRSREPRFSLPTDLPPGEHERVVGEEFTRMGTGEKIKVVPVIDVSTESLPIATEVMAAAARTAGGR